ncbi:DoxX family protein [Rummeliibacillus sp. NPDC094406]|uniref:DoxX family protein n=1 Tax=Rummeliibacillus sp. NPDC094406 TaxID=3364511 RepID=UPI003816B9A7
MHTIDNTFSFSIHGFDKLNNGIESLASWFSSIGHPEIFAYVVCLLEVMGGIALVAGLATHLLSCLFFNDMTVAIVKVKLAV